MKWKWKWRFSKTLFKHLQLYTNGEVFAFPITLLFHEDGIQVMFLNIGVIWYFKEQEE